MNQPKDSDNDAKVVTRGTLARRLLFSLSLILSTGFGGNAALASTRHHHHAGTHLSHHTHHYGEHSEHLARGSHESAVRLASSAHYPLHHQHIYYASRHEHFRYAAESRHRHQHYETRYASYHERYRHDYYRYASYHVHYGHHGYYRYASAEYRHSYLQCVPYAREISHIDLTGDAFLWWPEAAGRYARGNTPVEGAVLNFRAIRRMPLGHVAVVTAVIDSRTILTTQANWIPGTITNDVTMTDVSPNNDWSEVEVELGDSSKWGAPYPTYGFIYNQPDDGSVIANATAQGNEVAEAPRAVTIQTDAPDRDLQ
jgi:surface antigen